LLKKPSSTVLTPTSFTLQSHSVEFFKKDYNLRGIEVEIVFDYRIVSAKVVKDSTLVVTFNGQQVRTVIPSDNGTTIRFKVGCSRKTHVVGFFVMSFPSEPVHQIKISNLKLYDK
jgi:hypothetical protein